VKDAIKKRWIHSSSSVNALNFSGRFSSIGAEKIPMKPPINLKRINRRLLNLMAICRL
jgi:hypothetical protein